MKEEANGIEKDIFIKNFEILCNLNSIRDSDKTEKLKKYQQEYIHYKTKLKKLKKPENGQIALQINNAKYVKIENFIKTAQLGMISELDLFFALKNTNSYNAIKEKEESLRRILINPQSKEQSINDFLISNAFQKDFIDLKLISEIKKPFDEEPQEQQNIWRILNEEINASFNAEEEKKIIKGLQNQWGKAVNLEKKYAKFIKNNTYKNSGNPNEKQDIIEFLLNILQTFFLNCYGDISIICHILKSCYGKINADALIEAKSKIEPKKEFLTDPVKLLEFYKFIIKYGNKSQKKNLSCLKPHENLITKNQKLHKYDEGWIVIEDKLEKQISLPQKKPFILFFAARKKYDLSWQFSAFSLTFQACYNGLEKNYKKLPCLIEFDLFEYKNILNKIYKRFVYLEDLLIKQQIHIKNQITRIKKFGLFSFLYSSSNKFLKIWQGILFAKQRELLNQQREILLSAIKRFNGWLKVNSSKILLKSKTKEVKDLQIEFNNQIQRLKNSYNFIGDNLNEEIFKPYQIGNDLIQGNKAIVSDLQTKKTNAFENEISDINDELKEAKAHYAEALADRGRLTTAQFDLLIAIDPNDTTKLMIKRSHLHNKIFKHVDEIFAYIDKNKALLKEDKKYLSRVLRYFNSLGHEQGVEFITQKIKEYKSQLKEKSSELLKELDIELKNLKMKNINLKKLSNNEIQNQETEGELSERITDLKAM